MLYHWATQEALSLCVDVYFYVFSVKEKNENMPIHQNKMFLYILNKSNFLHHLDFWIYLASLTPHPEEEEALKTWTNP